MRGAAGAEFAKNSKPIEVSSTQHRTPVGYAKRRQLLSYASPIGIRASRDASEENIHSAISTFEFEGLAAAEAG
jgi:hypothetical protein